MNYEGLWAIIEDPHGDSLKYFAKSLITNLESSWAPTLEALLTVNLDNTSNYETNTIAYYEGSGWFIHSYISNNAFISFSQAKDLYPEYFI